MGGQTHSNNLLATANELLEWVWPFCGVGALRVKSVGFRPKIASLTSFWKNWKFPFKNGPVSLMCLLNPNFMQNFNKVRSQPWENDVTDGRRDGRTQLISWGHSIHHSCSAWSLGLNFSSATWELLVSTSRHWH